MSPPQTLSRRALLSAGGSCFAGSYLLDSGVFSGTDSASGATGWQQRWGDSTQRKFTSADPDPTDLGQSWTLTPEDAGSLTVECIGPDRIYARGYNRLLAYRRDDGSRQWTYSADEGSFSFPSLVGNTLVVQENATVHAVAADDGSARWTGHFATTHQPRSATVTLDGTAYLPGGRTYLGVHPATGFHRQTFDAKTLGTLVAAGDQSLFWWANGLLHMTDTDGETQWRRSLGRSHPPSGRGIAVTDSAVVVRHRSTDNDLVVTALDRDGGGELWTTSDDIDTGSAISAGPELVYVGTGRQVRAIEYATGEAQWTRTIDSSSPEPVVTPSTAYIPTTDGLVALDAATGSQRGDRLLSGRTVHSLAVADDAIYATADDNLVALEVGA
ncbi:PQQ-binding-like beta-propeller repeat protein [Salinibaculum rarum]|uniref:outer membrane protein assembly factor BamB family protein n=1 Tax=Salinibaculum rarum TaxID=3058903 RepID=UPI00265F5776|nr:PQQ-binding-like beta-propeller repeat protein [Salinibaculum sp. KK48]